MNYSYFILEYILRGGGKNITNVQLPGFNKFFLGIDNNSVVWCALPLCTTSTNRWKIIFSFHKGQNFLTTNTYLGVSASVNPP